MSFIAHYNIEDGFVQLLDEHLQHVADRFAFFARNCCLNEEHARQIGLYHDVGKASDEFQCYIKSGLGKVSHSNYGGFLLAKNDRIGSYCVFSHHTGLPDLGNMQQEGTTYLGRYQKVRKGDGNHYHRIDLPEIASFGNEKVRNTSLYPWFDASMEVRMYLSCLVDADWQDSANASPVVHADSWDVIYNRFFSKTEAYFKKVKEEDLTEKARQINEWRTEIFNDCRNAGENGTASIYSLSAPTGAGKTFASMAFALERVKRGTANRIIYCIPYTSIVEQNGQKYEKVLGKNNIVINHSLAEYANKVDNKDFVDSYMRWTVENWDAPIILSTNVQFFESLLSHKPARLRKIHNIANSVIILDEAQMLPYDFLMPCKEMLKLLAEEYHCTIVLCTATQPSLQIGEQGNELLTDAELMYERFKRVSAENIKESLSEGALAALIADDIRNGKSVLCVVNRRNTAQVLFNKLKEHRIDDLYHLSLNMCAKHRNKVLAEIKDKIHDRPVCVVSTSLIEAGVDLSFDIGYRELAGLERLVQASGRVNRHGEAEMGTIKIFRLFSMKYELPEQWVTE